MEVISWSRKLTSFDITDNIMATDVKTCQQKIILVAMSNEIYFSSHDMLF